MKLERLDEILARFRTLTICVFGDFSLDRYLDLECAEAAPDNVADGPTYQVSQARSEPGGGGKLVANLCALGVGAVRVTSCIGVDGEGFELAHTLARIGAETSALLESSQMHTPTRFHVFFRPPDGPPKMLHRLEMRNRSPLAAETEQELLRELRAALADAGAVLVVDEAPVANCGIVTDRIRRELCDLAAAHPEVIFFGHSALRTTAFQNMVTMPSLKTAAEALNLSPEDAVKPTEVAQRLYQHMTAPVYLFLGTQGTVLADDGGARQLPSYPGEAQGEVTFAYDAAVAILLAALSAGAAPDEAGLMANLAFSVAIEEVGVLTPPTPRQLRKRLEAHLGAK